jgi:hypothetical protein
MTTKNFLTAYFDGDVSAEAIHDYIECWHSGAGLGQSLHAYLGMTWEDYSAWVKDSEVLQGLLKINELTRKFHTRIGPLLNDYLSHPPLSTEADRVFVQDRLAGYLNEWVQKDQLKEPCVQCGTATSTALLRDRQHKPHYQQKHRATVHFTGGVQFHSIVVRGKWRKAKSLLRKWIRRELAALAADVVFQPVRPLTHITLTAIVTPTKTTVATQTGVPQ